MLHAPADTFRHRALLAVGLSWVAGYVNVVVLLTAGQTVSHMTGNATHLGGYVGRLLAGDHRPAAAVEAAYFAALVAAFGAGAFASGVLTRLPRRSRFQLPILLEASLLAVVVLMAVRWPHPTRGRPLMAVTLTAAVAMGLQNGAITRISGAVVRTTHLTGVVTDLGLAAANLLAAARAGRPLRAEPDAPRALLLSAILVTFVAGAVLGGAALDRFGPAALLAPVVFLTAVVVREQRAGATVTTASSGPPAGPI